MSANTGTVQTKTNTMTSEELTILKRIESKVDALANQPKPETVSCKEAMAMLETTNYFFNRDYRHRLKPDKTGKKFTRDSVEELKKEIGK